MLPFRNYLRRWMVARLPLEERCSLGQRRIYLLPTRFGCLLLLVAGLVWVGALNYTLSLAYVLSFWIVALLLVAVFMAYRQLAGLTITVAVAQPVFAGGEVLFELLLDNAIGIERQLTLCQIAPDGEQARSCRVASYTVARLALPVAASQRGRLLMPVCELASEAPFGLIRAFALLRLSASVLIYPRPVADVASVGAYLAGEGEGGVQPGEDEFSHLAEYQQGDLPRQIAWKVLASRDVLLAKRFVGLRTGIKRLDWQDYAPSCETELRLSRLAWRVEQCERSGVAYTLCLPGLQIVPQARQRELALAALAEYGGDQR
ncbi:DUF58 domain-containing protein [Neisseriaceae bacterium TC5R-5]|nr:DUF58 domain-containing protein [Neisseriaceae bacterium TC5R-5]